MNCKTHNLQHTLPGWAETQAHITLHAFLMSPILKRGRHNIRNTSLSPQPLAHRSMIYISFSTQT
ncbi:protein YnhH [Vagococcus sp. WN89Y]|uniref:protein YnhH n=1 Tax=Vagococcus sp. WN89Y TaxID=3457258 RepID=UPI003FCC98A5